MKKSLLLMLFLLLQVTTMSAAVVGDLIKRDGYNYRITNIPTHNVAFVGSDKSGALNIPATVKDSTNIEWHVTRIGNNSSVPNATSVTIPSSVNAMETGSLSGSKLTSIHIPASVTDISDGVFDFSLGLQSITVDPANPKYSASNGVLYETLPDGKYLKAYPVDKPGNTFSVPDGTLGIRPSAFQQNKNLETIELPQSLTQLPANKGYNGFTSAKKLKAINVNGNNPTFYSNDGVVFTKDHTELVTYPNAKVGKPYTIPSIGVTKIRDGAFSRVEGIEQVVMSEPLQEIGKQAFGNCIHLTSVTVPKTVNNISDGAFAGSYLLNAINVAAGNTTYKSDNGVVYNTAGTELVAYPAGKTGEYTTLSTTKKIKNNAFLSASKITKLTLTSGVEEIENDAFQYTSALKELVFQSPSSFKKMGTWVFVNSGLEKLELPASLETLGAAAFYGCKKLKTVTVADQSKLTNIGNGAFNGCTSLESFSFLGSSVLKTIETDAFRGDAKLPTFRIPKTVTTIGEGAFNFCSGMSTVTFDAPSQIETIGRGAFQQTGLTHIELPASLKKIEASAFNSCQKLKKINIPANVNDIDPKAFKFCGSLTEINVDDANPLYSSVDGILLNKDKTVLKTFPAGKAGTYYTMLPPTVEEIGPWAFYYIRNLENITIPEKVNKIDAYAFDMCDKLNTVAFLSKTPIPDASVATTAFNPANMNKSKIDLSVRKDAQAAYKASPLWNSFHNVGVSFYKNPDNYGATEYFPLSQKAVMVVDVQSDVYTYLVPAKVKNDADNKEYEVRLWGDDAMKTNNTNIQEVVFRNSLDYIGINAFKRSDGTSTVKNAFFTCSTPAKDMSATKWKLPTGNTEFTSTLTNIYVKKSAVAAYKTATGWASYANAVQYRIPGLTIKHKYGTFAREFDANLGIYAEENGSGDVAAFVAPVSPVYLGNGDYGVSKYMIKMSSIDGNGGVASKYSYVPAETGVLLKVINAEDLPANFYYAIGEEDNVERHATSNLMHGVIVKNTTLTGSDPYYLVSANKGVFQKMPANFTMPVHKAYAKITSLPAGAKQISFVIDELSGTDGIEAIDAETSNPETDNAYYNLNGQRVAQPQQGVYIHHGKKIIVK